MGDRLAINRTTVCDETSGVTSFWPEAHSNTPDASATAFWFGSRELRYSVFPRKRMTAPFGTISVALINETRMLFGRTFTAALFGFAALGALPASAQENARLTGEALVVATRAIPDLSFPKDAQPVPADTTNASGMVLWKPQGSGRFPAVVIHHSCGGIRAEIYEWARQAVSRGYVALVVDSLGPRGLKNVCDGLANVKFPRGVADAYDALHYLAGLPYVDPARVALMGFSWGGTVGLLAASETSARAFSHGERFAATVSFYPLCRFTGNTRLRFSVDYVRSDIDRPVLVLMGARDTEASPADCTSLLEPLTMKGAPVEYQTFSGLTHCWDCTSLDGLHKVDLMGNAVDYRYSREGAAESAQRAFDYLSAHIPGKAAE